MWAIDYDPRVALWYARPISEQDDDLFVYSDKRRAERAAQRLNRQETIAMH
jgi:hypothetical protein